MSDNTGLVFDAAAPGQAPAPDAPLKDFLLFSAGPAGAYAADPAPAAHDAEHAAGPASLESLLAPAQDPDPQAVAAAVQALSAHAAGFAPQAPQQPAGLAVSMSHSLSPFVAPMSTPQAPLAHDFAASAAAAAAAIAAVAAVSPMAPPISNPPLLHHRPSMTLLDPSGNMIASTFPSSQADMLQRSARSGSVTGLESFAGLHVDPAVGGAHGTRVVVVPSPYIHAIPSPINSPFVSPFTSPFQSPMDSPFRSPMASPYAHFGHGHQRAVSIGAAEQPSNAIVDFLKPPSTLAGPGLIYGSAGPHATAQAAAQAAAAANAAAATAAAAAAAFAAPLPHSAAASAHSPLGVAAASDLAHAGFHGGQPRQSQAPQTAAPQRQKTFEDFLAENGLLDSHQPSEISGASTFVMPSAAASATASYESIGGRGDKSPEDDGHGETADDSRDEREGVHDSVPEGKFWITLKTPLQTLYQCPYPDCLKTFTRPYNLKSHYRSHTGERPFKCDTCNQAFARKHDLKRHQKLHEGQKPFSCPACKKGFARSDALRRHLRPIEGNKESTCALRLRLIVEMAKNRTIADIPRLAQEVESKDLDLMERMIRGDLDEVLSVAFNEDPAIPA
ncbi:hypothetical protein HK105_204023 [Polyrhizophydium stewartii]|uniref:C2H2-type domain-containing protein n=1 Tax=Polyrhizophydium stewartii TaxID=2732419 RepID=A0ABR4N9R8_9FUNG